MPQAPSTTLIQGESAEPNSWTGSSGGFDGTGWDDNGTETGFVFIPPDPHAAAGPDHLVSVVNVMIQIRDKYTGASLFLDSLKDFFTDGLDTDGPVTFTFDPKVIYDQYEERWVVITMEQTELPADPNTSRIFVAVSDDEDPMGNWNMAVFDSSITILLTDYWADYPGFATDDQAIYITANLFSFGSNSGGGVQLWIIDKGVGSGGLYDGGVAAVMAHDPYAGNGALDVTTQPAHMYGPVPGNLGTFLVGFSGLHYTSGSQRGEEVLQVVTVEDPLGTPNFTLQYVDTGNIETNNSALPDADQSGTNTEIEVNDRRTLDAVWRELDGDNSLWLTMTIFPSSGANRRETTAYWAEINTTNLLSLVLSDQGEIGGEDIASGTFTFFPSIAVDSLGNMVTGFSASDGSIFPGAYFVTRSPGDAAGTTSASQTVKAGTDYYIRTFGGFRNRWGDYSAAVVDSARGCFWFFNEWADTQSAGGGETGRWGTAWAKTCTCAQTLRPIPASEWESIALPCNPWPDNQVQDVFPQLDPADYQGTWGVVEFDASVGAYRFLTLTEEMYEGRGYWIFSELATTAQTDGSPHIGDDISLTGVATIGQFNLLGNQQNGTVDWNDFLVVDGSMTTYTLDQVDPLDTGPNPDINECDKVTPGPTCWMSRIMHKWHGSGYDTFDGSTLAMEGSLAPYDNFWVKVFTAGIMLRSPTSVAAAAVAESGKLALSTEISGTQSSQAATTASNSEDKKKKSSGWYVRLIASADGKESQGNVFGQLSDSIDGLDRHDLETLQPFGSSYLGVLFTNPLLGEADWGFVSDYRALTKKPAGAWPFVVRASAEVSAVTLSWEGEDRLFKKAWLLDEQTGEIYAVKRGGSYTFTMDSSGESHFTIGLD